MGSERATHSLIEIRGLTKRYGDKRVLDGLDLTIERGETCVIVGGSGSGKTTLVRLLVGLDRPDSGEIRIDGIDIAHARERELDEVRPKFAVVFQNHALLDSLTVFDNVAFPLREELHLRESEVRRRAYEALRELGVEDAARKLPEELSGGMAKRVAVARAVVIKPEIIVYDEPTSGLDPVTSRTVDALIDDMRARFSVTSVVITHDMVTAYEIADRVVLIAQGKAVAEGPPDELFHARGSALEPFARSSGVDLEKLTPRKSHVRTHHASR